MRHLDFGRDAIQKYPVLRPVKLIGLGWRERQRYECIRNTTT